MVGIFLPKTVGVILPTDKPLQIVQSPVVSETPQLADKVDEAQQPTNGVYLAVME